MLLIFAVLLAAVTSVVGNSYRKPRLRMTDPPDSDGNVPYLPCNRAIFPQLFWEKH
jgi:hypothetical protein